jgi:hypothetical protein
MRENKKNSKKIKYIIDSTFYWLTGPMAEKGEKMGDV